MDFPRAVHQPGVTACLYPALLTAAHEDDLPCYASLRKQLLRVSCLGKGQSLRDEGLDRSLSKEVQQRDQILSKHFRFQPFERLDAVRDHPFPAREKPAAGDVQPEDGTSPTPISTTWTS